MKFLTWLKSLFVKYTQGKNDMSEQPIEVSEEQAPVTTDNTDALLAKVKELLKVAGHDVEAVFDDVAALAKKLV